MKLKSWILINSLIIIALCGLSLLVYHYINPNKDIERFYHQNDKMRYYMLYTCYSVLMISLAWNIRYFLTTLIKK